MLHARKQQEPESSFAAFIADCVASSQRRRATQQEGNSYQAVEYSMSDLPRCDKRKGPNQRWRANEYPGHGHAKATPIITAASRSHSQFAFEDRKEDHSSSRISPVII